MTYWSSGSDLCLLPYPDGKSFAFTIIDDTDGSTLETVRPIYEYLLALGLKTTKTVWVSPPETAPERASDAGDTLEREEYAQYLLHLKRHGFEIALHNVSSKSNDRARIFAGMERFRQIFGAYPRINVHHEKNLENLHFDFARSGRHLPPPFQTALLQGLSRLSRRVRPAQGARQGCSGEDRASPYFWGDLCKERIDYVRSNVFFQDLNTLKCNPRSPYAWPETPYVNHWFDSSNGQDRRSLNAMLSERNIGRLRSERGCSILYTHFGKDFVVDNGGEVKLNAETRQRLRAIAGHDSGWYVPVGVLLDRLLAFQQVSVVSFRGGIVLANHNGLDLESITLEVRRGKTFSDLEGERFTADERGRIVFPALRAGQVAALVHPGNAAGARRWFEKRGRPWLLDLKTAARKAGERIHAWPDHRA